MKRTPKKHYCVIRTYPLLFWRKCVKCKREFRREWGWKYETGNYNQYICSACAPTIDVAETLPHYEQCVYRGEV